MGRIYSEPEERHYFQAILGVIGFIALIYFLNQLIELNGGYEGSIFDKMYPIVLLITLIIFVFKGLLRYDEAMK